MVPGTSCLNQHPEWYQPSDTALKIGPQSLVVPRQKIPPAGQPPQPHAHSGLPSFISTNPRSKTPEVEAEQPTRLFAQVCSTKRLCHKRIVPPEAVDSETGDAMAPAHLDRLEAQARSVGLDGAGKTVVHELMKCKHLSIHKFADRLKHQPLAAICGRFCTLGSGCPKQRE